MNSTKRIGGYIRARIIQTKNVQQFQVTEGRCTIIPKSPADIIELDFQKNAIIPSVDSSTEKAGIIYSITINIDVKNQTNIKNPGFNKYLVILENASTGSQIFGTLNYPLTLVKKPLTPSEGSGRIGERLVFTGKQLNYPYLFSEN
jgi:hypothetical protein